MGVEARFVAGRADVADLSTCRRPSLFYLFVWTITRHSSVSHFFLPFLLAAKEKE